MKKLVLAMATLLALTSLTGCLRMHNEVVLEKDGSGSMTFEMGITQTVADALQEMQALDPTNQDMEMPSLDEMNKDDIQKAVKPYDVKLTKFDRSTVDGRENIAMAFDFKDLKGMSAAMSAVMGGAGDGDGLGIYDAGDGNFVLKQATYDFSDMPMPEKKEAETEPAAPTAQTPEVMQKQMELMGKLMGSLSELDVRMAITVPGDIVESNAPEQDGRTSIWIINGENMMTQGQNMEPVITFSGKGLKIKSLTE
ncbi:MAG: hypothetical protein GY838_00310 [bacterium]|nr:hypothetical protein [bacterium]